MVRPFSVAVYCSSSNRVDEEYFEVATALGRALGERKWRLVFGAGTVGLMGAVARGAHAEGGEIFGVITHLLDEWEVTYEACDQLLRVETMRQRKALMEQNSDVFIALPGGIGTLEEIIEVLVLKQLGYLDRPIVFLNTRNYWAPLIALFEEMIEQRFVSPSHRERYKVVDTVEEALAYIATYHPSTV
ncbi:MAG: TIGR00730 family Rossman fold protein [Ardenticatenaceae bacterium]